MKRPERRTPVLNVHRYDDIASAVGSNLQAMGSATSIGSRGTQRSKAEQIEALDAIGLRLKTIVSGECQLSLDELTRRLKLLLNQPEPMAWYLNTSGVGQPPPT